MVVTEAASIINAGKHEPKFYSIQSKSNKKKTIKKNLNFKLNNPLPSLAPPGTRNIYIIECIIKKMFELTESKGEKLKLLICTSSIQHCDELSKRLKGEVSQLLSPDYDQSAIGRLVPYFGKYNRDEEDAVRKAVIVVSPIVACNAYGLFSSQSVSFTSIILPFATELEETSSLVPLTFGCNKIIQMGDPQQLPVYLRSNKAQELGYDHSQFSRLFTNFKYSPHHKNPIRMLSEQYQMHPSISKFPSKYFYNGELYTSE